MAQHCKAIIFFLLRADEAMTLCTLERQQLHRIILYCFLYLNRLEDMKKDDAGWALRILLIIQGRFLRKGKEWFLLGSDHLEKLGEQILVESSSSIPF